MSVKLEPLGLFDAKNPGKGHFLLITSVRAKGTEYGPLLTDGYAYLCPDCGGYGTIHHKKKCLYCKGIGEIPLNDPRVIRDDG